MDTTLDISRIYPNPNQPRKEFDPGKLEELAMSIKQYGVLEPILVTPRGERYMIIGGERRYRASLLAGLGMVPARIIEADDALVEELALLENVQRQDLNIVEEGRAYQALLDRGWSKEDLARKLGFRNTQRVDARLSLLNLLPEYQVLAMQGKLNHNEAYEMSRVSPGKQAMILNQIIAGKLPTYNKLRAYVNALIALEDQQTIFTFQTISEPEKKSIGEFEAMVRSVERFMGSLDKDRKGHLKKTSFHCQVTTERLDLIIQHLLKLRRIIHVGEGIKTATEETAYRR